jgi:transcriptional regulator with XRE-family HTH domain
MWVAPLRLRVVSWPLPTGGGRWQHVTRNGSGTKAQRDQLRRAMQQQGCTPEQIAAEMTLKWGYRPRQAWRHAHGLTQDDVAARYNQLVDSDQAAMAGKRISDFEAWPHGGVKPTLTTLKILADIYGTTTWTLTDHDDRQALPSHERIALKPQSGDSNTYSEYQSPQLVLPATPVISSSGSRPTLLTGVTAGPLYRSSVDRPIHDLIMSAAYESRHHAESAQEHIMPDATLEEVNAEVERLTREHLYQSSISTFPDTLQTRDKIYRLLEYQQYPRQTTHLYYLASVICALLADMSANVGFPRAALEQARAGWAYAEIIGHNSLRLWCRIKEAALADAEDRPQRALDLVSSASSWATEPLGKVSLYNALAVYSARTARADEARVALTRAFDAHDSSPGSSDLFDHLGGMFSYPREKLLQVSGTTYLELGDISVAENNSAEAITYYETGPLERRARGNEASARIDVGHSRLLRGDVEGASEALEPVLQLPTSRRIGFVGSRLRNFQSTLRNQNVATSHFGRDLMQSIEEFFARKPSDEFPNPTY